MKKRVVLGAMLLSSAITFAQDFLAKNEYFFSLTNGLDILVVRDSTAKDISLGMVFQCGSLTERDAFHGLSFIYERIITLRLNREMEQIIPEYKLDPSLFKVSSETTYEYMSVKLIFPKNHLGKVLETISNVVRSPFTGDEIAEAAAYSNSEYHSKMLDPSFSVAQKIGTSLWENDYKKRITINTWNDSTIALIPQKIAKFREKYFCPGNCFLVIKGNVTHKAVYAEVQDQSIIFASDKNLIFEHWPKCTINPFTRFPAPNYRLVLTSRQLVDENPLTRAPFFRMAFPGPNTYEDRRSNYCALVLSAILASPASKIHRLLQDSCGLASMSLHNDLAKYISQITFEFSTKDSNEAAGYECFRSFLMNMTDSILTEQVLTLGKDIVISNFRANQADNPAHVSQIIKFWSSVTLNDYSTFEDSIRSISINDMKVMFKRYFYGRHYVAALSIQPQLRQSLHIDTTFTATESDIKSYRIEFLKNSASFSGPKDDSTLTSLIQFLKINPHMMIKVNGNCHKDELLNFTDQAMFDWIRSLEPAFIINPPSLVKQKKFRLDIYRSLTIIKKLAEAGIDPKRLLGTGFLSRTPGETEPFQYAYFSEVVVN